MPSTGKTQTTAGDFVRGAAGFAAGGVYGLSLARFLFESAPSQLEFWNTGAGAALTAAGCGLIAFSLPRRRHADSPARFSFLVLLLPAINLLAPEANLLRAQALLLGAASIFSVLALLPWEAGDRDLREGSFSPPSRGAFVVGPWPLFLIIILLYCRTLAPAVGEADTFEFQVGAIRLGIAHGSGYPLLMLIGKLFTLLPIGGTVAFRANLASAVFGALAGVGVERLTRRLGATPLFAFLAGLAFGVSPTLWSRAVEIEAYTLNAALVTAILWLALEIAHGRVQHRLRFARRSWPVPCLYLLALVFGLSLTNHLTTLLLAPACLLAVLSARPRFPTRARRYISRAAHIRRLGKFFGRRLALGILALALGLSIYLYLPLRWPAINHGELLSWAKFIHIIAGGEAQGAFQALRPFTEPDRYGIVFGKIVAEYGQGGMALALLGLAALASRARRPALILASAGASYVYFALAFDVPDPDFSAFLIPLHLIAAVLMAIGLQGIWRLTGQIDKCLPSEGRALASQQSGFLAAGPRQWAFVLVAGGFCLLPFASIWNNLPRVDKSAAWEQYHLGQFILRLPLAPNAAILADSQKIAPLYYLQIAEGIRPDLDIIVLPAEADYRAALAERLAAGQTVYLARYLPGLGSEYHLRSIGPLVEVSPTIPLTIARPLSATLAGEIRLLGYDAEALLPKSHAPGANFNITLYWTTAAAADANYLVYLRLKDTSGKTVWQNYGSVPVGGMYPVNAWRPGEVIADFYSMPLEPTLPPGNYQLETALFPPFQMAETGWTAVTTVTVMPTRGSPSPAHALRARFGDNRLMGGDVPETAPPGTQVNVVLYWLNTGGTEVTVWGQTTSLAKWPNGQIVPVKYRLVTPLAGDELELKVNTGAPAQCGWLAPITSACGLPPIRLTGKAVPLTAVNFDQKILLTEAIIDTPSVAAGAQAAISLKWLGLQKMTRDYTVFVHLLGPDGRVYGQVDTWPVSGTRATSTWTAGEVIADRYRILVPADAPRGEYKIEIGLYLLATLERLPVLNAEGAVIDDKVIVAGLKVE